MNINPPLIALLIAMGMLAISIVLPQPHLIPPPLNAFGLVLVALGVAMNLWSARRFQLRKTTINPRGEAAYLVQEGLYRFTRNPMYLGMLITLLGVSVYWGSWAAYAGPPLYVWVISRQFIRREEQDLLAHFGEEYAQYSAQVRRWI